MAENQQGWQNPGAMLPGGPQPAGLTAGLTPQQLAQLQAAGAYYGQDQSRLVPGQMAPIDGRPLADRRQPPPAQAAPAQAAPAPTLAQWSATPTLADRGTPQGGNMYMGPDGSPQYGTAPTLQPNGGKSAAQLLDEQIVSSLRGMNNSAVPSSAAAALEQYLKLQPLATNQLSALSDASYKQGMLGVEGGRLGLAGKELNWKMDPQRYDEEMNRAALPGLIGANGGQGASPEQYQATRDMMNQMRPGGGNPQTMSPGVKLLGGDSAALNLDYKLRTDKTLANTRQKYDAIVAAKGGKLTPEQHQAAVQYLSQSDPKAAEALRQSARGYSGAVSDTVNAFNPTKLTPQQQADAALRQYASVPGRPAAAPKPPPADASQALRQLVGMKE